MEIEALVGLRMGSHTSWSLSAYFMIKKVPHQQMTILLNDEKNLKKDYKTFLISRCWPRLTLGKVAQTWQLNCNHINITNHEQATTTQTAVPCQHSPFPKMLPNEFSILKIQWPNWYAELEVPRQINIIIKSDRASLCACYSSMSRVGLILHIQINMIHRMKCRCWMPFECEVNPYSKHRVATTKASSNMECSPMEVWQVAQ